MADYSIADAKNHLPKLIDRAVSGEEVMITRRGKPVAEIKPASRISAGSGSTYEWLVRRRKARKGVAVTSVEILDEIYAAPPR